MRINNNQINYFNNDVLIYGSLSALSGTTFTNTIFTTTSALSVINTGTGPALYVSQAPGNYDIASFHDRDGVEVLHIGNAFNGLSGRIGINESYPGAELTVNGAISSNGAITVLGGNSNQWNIAYNYATTYPVITAVSYTPYNLIGATNTNTPIFTVPVGRKFICTSFGGNIIEVASTSPASTCTVRLINSTRGNNATISTNFTPPVANIAAIDNTSVYGNVNSVAVSGGETVSLRLANAPTGFTTLSAVMFASGILI